MGGYGEIWGIWGDCVIAKDASERTDSRRGAMVGWQSKNPSVVYSCVPVSTLVVPPITSSSSYHWCSCNSSSAVWGTSHQLSPAISRQRLKPKPSAPTIRLSRWAHASSILGDGGVHFDAAACPKVAPPAELWSFRSVSAQREVLAACGRIKMHAAITKDARRVR